MTMGEWIAAYGSGGYLIRTIWRGGWQWWLISGKTGSWVSAWPTR